MDVEKEVLEIKRSLVDHFKDDRNNFDLLHQSINEIKAMLKPINEAFTFKGNLGKFSISIVKNTAATVGLILSLIVLWKIVWSYIISQLFIGK